MERSPCQQCGSKTVYFYDEYCSACFSQNGKYPCLYCRSHTLDFYSGYDGDCSAYSSETTMDEWTIADSLPQTTQTRGEDNLQFLQQERHRQFHLPPLTTEIQPEPAWHAKEQLVVVPAGVAIGEPTVKTDCEPGSNVKVEQYSHISITISVFLYQYYNTSNP